MTFWHIELPGFLIISSVSGIVNVISLVLTVASWLLIFLLFGID